MPRIYPLFSSSEGNCTYIGSEGSGILVDCGVSFSRIKKAMELSGLDISSVKCVFITHEHIDHVRGLAVLTKKTGIPVFSKSLTLDRLYDKGLINSTAHDISDGAAVDGITVRAFDTSHDAVSSCGYRVDLQDGKSCAVCTDLGYVSEKVSAAVTGSDAVLLEANYDEKMLRTGSYPAALKARIRSDSGHLSNIDSAGFAVHLVKKGTTRLILGHLSQENNTPANAEYAVENALSEAGMCRGRDYLLSCAPVETDGGFISF